MQRASEKGVKDFKLMLFTVPCCVCGEPAILTHKSENAEQVMKTLHRAFSDWGHRECIRRAEARG